MKYASGATHHTPPNTAVAMSAMMGSFAEQGMNLTGANGEGNIAQNGVLAVALHKIILIGDNGEMILRAPDGSIFRFDCGDVKIDVSLINFNLLVYNNKQQK